MPPVEVLEDNFCLELRRYIWQQLYFDGVTNVRLYSLQICYYIATICKKRKACVTNDIISVNVFFFANI